MYELRKLLLSIDLSPMDKHLIKVSIQSSRFIEYTQVVLIHIIEDPLHEKYKGAKEDEIEEFARDYIRGLFTQEEWQRLSNSIKVFVKKGTRVTEILHASRKFDTDVIIVGRKVLSEGKGLTAQKLARRALCSVLIVPENASIETNKILLPIDFSEFSKIAFERVLYVAKNHPGIQIVLLHVYKLPNGFYHSGKSAKEFTQIMRQNAKKRYEFFIKQFQLNDTKVRIRFELDALNDPARIIFNVGLVEGADLVVIGSRGRTDLAAAFLGSTTEKILHHNLSMNTLVIKQKTQNLNFFQAILNI